MKHLFQNKIVKGFASLLLILSFVTISYGPGPHTPKAEAQWAVAGIGPNEIVTAIESTITAVSAVASQAYDAITSWAANSLQLKEFSLDGIAWEIINLLIQQMSRSIVEWINSGFEGSPAFITDFDGFMLDIADIQAGRFLTELGLGLMCSPFKFDIQLSLAIKYQAARSYEAQCRLSDVVTNIDNFLAGDFNEGGWGGWLALTTVPSNNPHGGMLEAEGVMLARISNARGEARTESLFGEGFLTFKECGPDIDEDGNEVGQTCWNSTPGAVIEQQLNNNLDSPRGRLLVADEINEILGALFNQLVLQAFSGAGGLLGLTSSGYSPEGFSYVEAASQPTGDNGGLSTDTLAPIDRATDVEQRYIAQQERIIAIVNATEQYLNNSCAAGILSLPSSFVNLRTTAQNEIQVAQNNISTLQSLAVQYTDEIDPNQKLVIFQTFVDLQNSGTLHDEVEVATLEARTVSELTRDAGNFRGEVNSYECPDGTGGVDPNGDIVFPNDDSGD